MNGSLGGGSPPRLSLASRRGFGNRHAEPVASASRKWSNRSRPTCEDGSDTLVIVKRPRYCKPLKRGYAVDFGRWCGSNGSEDGHGFANFASGASGQTSRHQLPGVLTALGGLRTRPLSPSLCRTPTLPSSDFHSWSCGLSLIRRTAVCGPACTVVWQGRRGDPSPYADWHHLYHCRTTKNGGASLRH